MYHVARLVRIGRGRGISGGLEYTPQENLGTVESGHSQR